MLITAPKEPRGKTATSAKGHTIGGKTLFPPEADAIVQDMIKNYTRENGWVSVGSFQKNHPEQWQVLVDIYGKHALKKVRNRINTLKRQAMFIALKELGVPKEIIHTSTRQADTHYVHEFGETDLHTEIDKPLSFPPGQTDRDYINALKSEVVDALLLSKIDPDFIKKQVAISQAKIQKKHSEN